MSPPYASLGQNKSRLFVSSMPVQHAFTWLLILLATRLELYGLVAFVCARAAKFTHDAGRERKRSPRPLSADLTCRTRIQAAGAGAAPRELQHHSCTRSQHPTHRAQDEGRGMGRGWLLPAHMTILRYTGMPMLRPRAVIVEEETRMDDPSLRTS